ncbi:two-component system, chemotaxis family, CheB/CheR fusion protein [Chitinophaga sp. CF118]|uniref:CheR family methyltransferase n=1 Tax=Chitinophaga sp. CF118 TaxID=1884367 RepID=UPI0008F0A199|nr:CheR family methyltransferase [Chitinophaga sp. CF118]SFD18441.1 two-component system, chemotaxis family, CheB/CheR fusion protein [Chitinophaga sp. CF118]
MKKANYIIAIGASAGGLEAIHEFFDNMPEYGNLSFVIIQHLSPDYKSLLVELVSKHTNMKVREVEKDMPVESDCVYVIPNNKEIIIDQGRLQLQQKPAGKRPNTAIDTFLFSLAKDKGRYAICIILSGTGTDGTRGAGAIKKAGGMVMVQDPESARFDGMPRSAINSENIDYVLAPEFMPGEIYNLIQDMPVQVFNGKIDEELLPEVFQLVRENSGQDFHHYKSPTITRRIARRMTQFNLNTLEDYLQVLRQNPEENKLLAQDFLIGVTRFFRDKGAFEVIKDQILSKLIEEKEEGAILKIWVTACSTGEEVYSIAILLDQCLQKRNKWLDIKIFATDIDSNAIEYAARGSYPAAAVNVLDPAILKKYFLKEENKYQIVPRLRKQIVFARHNILKDPPFIKNDLVTCRNMLIYMDNVLQRQVLASLHFALNTGGYLFLGPSESATVIRGGLEEVSSKWKIYRKSENLRGAPPENLYSPLEYIRKAREMRTSANGMVAPEKRVAAELLEEFRQVMADDYGYAAVYIDKNYEIREAIGNYKKYLSLPEKKLNLNLLKMVPADLAMTLNMALRQAWKTEQKVPVKGVKLNTKEGLRVVNMLIKPGVNTLIVFGEEPEKTIVFDHTDISDIHTGGVNEHILLLEAELGETRTNLQMAIEGLETSNEELQSSNEELLSANEELQSSNEELQSLNEELHTLNTEHQLKIKELIELNDDMNNYFRSTDIGQVFVDARLRIRKFNPAAVKMINLIPTDIGRPINHISTNIQQDSLIDDINTVILNKDTLEKEMVLSNGNIHLMKIMPYIRQDKQTDGVVITFVDITAIKELDMLLKGVFNASTSVIMAFKAITSAKGIVTDFRLLTANKAASRLLGKNMPRDVSMLESLPQLTQQGLFEKYVQVAGKGRMLHTEFKTELNRQDAWFELAAVKTQDGIVITCNDLTEKKDTEDRLRRNYNELVQARESLRILNAALEDKVLERTHELTQSEERFRMVSQATNDTIWDWNLTNNEVWWSDNFYSVYGYSRDNKTSGRSFWLENIHPDDRDRIHESITRAVSTKQSQWSEGYRLRRSDGSYAHVLDRGYLMLDEYATPYRMLGSMMDVTILREAEELAIVNMEEKRFLAESMPLILWTAMPNGEINFVNQQFITYTGLSFESIKEKRWNDIIHQDDLSVWNDTWNTAVKSKEDFSTELRLKRYDNLYNWFLMRGRAQKDMSGVAILWVGTSTDIHEQKTLAELMEQRVMERTTALQKANQELESSNTELQQYAFVASHDLKEPLRKIHMFGNMLRERYQDNMEDKAMDYLDRIINSSSRMTSLINDLLKFSRLSQVNFFEQVNLEVIIKEILSDLEIIIQEKNAIVTVGSLPIIEAVPGQLRQVFQNLLSNAFKFSRKDIQPMISITASRIKYKQFDSPADPAGSYACITISDNGIGFDEKYLDKIFVLFQRLHTKDKFEGTGIGLAVTRKIVDKHNGLITAHSREKEGATFTIILPVKQEQEAG